MASSTDTSTRWKELGGQIQIFLQWGFSSIIDSAFLALWVFLQWLVDAWVIQQYELSNVDKWVLLAFQIIFAVSTVIPVIIFIYTDISIMLLRSRRRIQDEARIGKENQHNEH